MGILSKTDWDIDVCPGRSGDVFPHPRRWSFDMVARFPVIAGVASLAPLATPAAREDPRSATLGANISVAYNGVLGLRLVSFLELLWAISGVDAGRHFPWQCIHRIKYRLDSALKEEALAKARATGTRRRSEGFPWAATYQIDRMCFQHSAALVHEASWQPFVSVAVEKPRVGATAMQNCVAVSPNNKAGWLVPQVGSPLLREVVRKPIREVSGFAPHATE